MAPVPYLPLLFTPVGHGRYPEDSQRAWDDLGPVGTSRFCCWCIRSWLAALVAARLMVPATKNLDLHGSVSDGTRIGVVLLISPIIALMLASRRSGGNVLVCPGSILPAGVTL
jgi:hypothetical protein